MNERSAREVALVRAVEMADREQRLLGADERAQASRSAREFWRWQASATQDAGAADQAAEGFLQKRSALLLDRLGARHAVIAAWRHPGHWWAWAGVAAPFAALLAGLIAERIVNPQRVDLLSGALLLIVAWNLTVYLGLLLWPLAARRRPVGRTGVLTVPAAIVQRLATPREKTGGIASGGALQAAVFAFGRDWAHASAPLTALRVARTLHLSAALFALGAIGSLYLRGIVSEYRVGWESTFLDAAQVHALLSWVFWPVVELLGMQPFTIEQIAALRFGRPPLLPAASGARWVHLYAALLALVVVAPRLLLAAIAWRAERRLVRTFTLDLNEPYFRRLLAAAGQGDVGGAVLRVLPYSFRIDERREQGLRDVAAQLLGADARLALQPSTGYGGEPAASDAPTDLGERTGRAAAVEPALTLALFNLAATPEKENHGAFLDHLVATAAPHRGAALIDESSLAERLGRQDAGASARLAQRRELWSRFCGLHGVPVAFVDLFDPSLSGIEHDLGPRVATPLTTTP